MAPRTALTTLAIAIAASLALSLGLYGIARSQAQDAASTPSPELGVEWDYQPDDLVDLVANSPAIVLAEVQAIQAGEPLVTGPADPETGLAPSIPTQRIDLHVVQAVEGETPQDFTLFKLGGLGEHPEGSPAFELGERDLLFVRPRLNDEATALNPDGTWIVVAPDGRLEKVQSGELVAPLDGPIADALASATVPEAVAEIEQAQAAASSDSGTEAAPPPEGSP